MLFFPSHFMMRSCGVNPSYCPFTSSASPFILSAIPEEKVKADSE
jgi:hypothetical protein